MRGFFITLEGVEGCGKSTQIRLLSEQLKRAGFSVITTREPGEGVVGERIRNILLATSSGELQALTEFFLLLADRRQHVKTFIEPAVESGSVVICDRYIDSSSAYQGSGRGLSAEFIRNLNDIATDNLKPDLTLLLDMDSSTGLGRSKERLKQLNMFEEEGRFEVESSAFHRRVREGYLQLAAENPERFSIVNADRDMDVIARDIWEIVKNRFNRWNKADNYD